MLVAVSSCLALCANSFFIQAPQKASLGHWHGTVEGTMGLSKHWETSLVLLNFSLYKKLT